MQLTRAAAVALCFALVVGIGLSPVVFAAEQGTGPSAFAQFIVWIQQQQRAFHEELTQSLRAITEGGGLVAGLGLVSASFLYGVFHAAGPGHGKAVLTTYLLTNRTLVRRGIWIAVAAAFCQGLTAITIVYGLISVAGWLPSDTTAAVTWSERLSYSLVFLVGAFLAGRAGWRLLGLTAPKLVPANGSTHGHGHRHEHHHDHDHHGCGHSHGPTSDQIASARDLSTTLGVILSIGLRPCSGAVVVLIFAYFLGLAWAGIGAVAAMSLGTAIAVSTLALLAVNARGFVASYAPSMGNVGRYLGIAISIAGGLFVMAIGWSLLSASFGPVHPLALS